MKIGVIGAGVMGAGIAQVFAASGHDTVLCDISEKLALAGKEKISRSLERFVSKGKLEQAQADQVIFRIHPGLIGQAADCDLIIEAVIEDMAVKKDLFHTLQNICRKEAIFASNTSSLSLTEMSKGLDRPVVGMHFFNPAPVMKLVEVVAGLGADTRVINQVVSIAEKIGKTPVRVNEGAGFVVNRILAPMINEAAAVYADGIASVQDIDTAMKLGANHPMGPLELGDLIGLDVCLAILETLHGEYGGEQFRPHPLLKKMVRGGLYGKKSGKGFYTY